MAIKENTKPITTHEISEFGKAMKYFEVTELSLLLNNQMIEEYAQTLTLKNKNNQ